MASACSGSQGAPLDISISVLLQPCALVSRDSLATRSVSKDSLGPGDCGVGSCCVPGLVSTPCLHPLTPTPSQSCDCPVQVTGEAQG